MKKEITKVIVVSVLMLFGLVGCANFVTNTQRGEITTTHLVYGAYVGWTNYYVKATNTYAANPDQLAKLEDMRLKVKASRMDYVATINVLDSWLTAYQSNLVTKAQVQSVVDATLTSSSNVVWLINYFKANQIP
jgi:hypothetical protein